MSRVPADTSVFHAIADPVRRAMLLALSHGEQAAGDLIEPFDISQSAASQHLAVLRRAGLVEARRDGRRRVYRVTPEPLHEVSSWVRHFNRFWDDRLGRLGRHLDRQAAGRPRR